MAKTPINKVRLKEAKEQFEKVISILDNVSNDKINLREASNKLGITQQYMNRELSNSFYYYFKSWIKKVEEEDLKKLIKSVQTPSEILLNMIFQMDDSEFIVYPYYDEDYLWETVKSRVSEKGFIILSYHCGYNLPLTISNEVIGNKLGISRVRVGKILKASLEKLRTASVCSEIFTHNTTTAIKEIEEQLELKRNEYDEAYNKLVNTLNIIEQSNNIKKLSTDELRDIVKKETNLKLKTSLEDLNFSNRTLTRLEQLGFKTAHDIIEPKRVNKTIAELCDMNGLGKKSLTEITTKMDCLFKEHPIWVNTKNQILSYKINN